MTDVSGPPFRADHVGSLLRPPSSCRRALDGSRRAISTPRSCERSRTRRSPTPCGMQRDVGLRSVDRRRVPPRTWHMDFIYGSKASARYRRRRGGPLPQPGRDDRLAPRGAPARDGPHHDRRDDLRRRLRLPSPLVAGGAAKLTIPSPSWSTTGAAPPHRPGGLPRAGRVLGGAGGAYAARSRRRRAGLHLPAAGRHEPGLPQRPVAAGEFTAQGGDAEHQHERYIRQINAALRGARRA